MNTNIPTTRFFKTKEQYKTFRTAFAASQNGKQNSKLTSAHFLLFNLVVGHNYYSGFSPKTKTSFIENGGNADRGLNFALAELFEHVRYAKCLLGLEKIKVPSYLKDDKKFLVERTTAYQKAVNAFLIPFDGGFTLQDLARIQRPPFRGLTTEEIKQKVTYAQAFGDQVVDHTQSDDQVPNVVEPINNASTQETSPVKKGFFKKLFRC